MVVNSIITGMRLCAYLTVLILTSLYCSPYDREIDCTYRLVFADVLGYSLIGEKPVSHDYIQDYYLKTHPQVCEKFIASLKQTFKNSDKYILKVFAFNNRDGKKDYEVELIHKRALGKLISENTFLQTYIENKFSCIDGFYKEIENPSVNVFGVVKNELIAGILFGYGEENARHYCRTRDLGFYLNKRPYVTLYGMYIGRLNLLLQPNFPGKIIAPYAVQIPQVSEGFKSLEDEWAYIKSVDVDVASTSAANPPYFINLPIYIARRGAQSKAVQAKFLRARERLAKVFDGKSYQQAVEDRVRQE